MSNIYIQEPPTSGKVLLLTTVGEIEIELWSKEAPKACRNFVQLCMESYYNGTIFHRVVHGFIAQGGDPTGTGEGGESIYGEPFKDEIHSRLRFNRRGLVAMANSGKDDNGSQFFFTLAPTPELQGKHTIFGKVGGQTIYNMIKLEEGEVDENERPLHCHKINKTEILSNPFPDIAPRVTKTKKSDGPKKKEKKEGVKNFKLLSFGEEAEEDEEENISISKKLASSKKSSHDLLEDPKLSKEPAVTTSRSSREKSSSPEEREPTPTKSPPVDDYYLGKERDDELQRRREQIQKEIEELKDDYKNRKRKHEETSEGEEEKSNKPPERNEMVDEYKANLVKYKQKMEKLPEKGSSREKFTLQLLQKFQNKLKSVKEKALECNSTREDGGSDDETWMSHQLEFEPTPVLARDANTKGDDWFDITDPRNAINKRRREAKKEEMDNVLKKLKE